MTTLKYSAKIQGIQREVRQIRQVARKLAASKASAKRFLVSTGIYTAAGQLKPQFR